VKFEIAKQERAMKLFPLALVIGTLAISVFGGEEPVFTPKLFSCQVRYHYREQFHVKVGEKSVSAPAFHRKGLPASHVIISDRQATRIVEGGVSDLPYRFIVKITASSDDARGVLEIIALDRSGKPLEGFPYKMPNPIDLTPENSRYGVEIPIPESLKTKIEKGLFSDCHHCFITYVELVIGMDEDFVSTTYDD
jgi:hypothetical protein